MAAAAAARIETLLAGEQSQRASAYEELAAVASVELAKACVASLVNVLCAPEERIGSAEAQRAYLVLGGLMLLDPVAVGAELLRGDQMWAAGSTPGNALAAMLAPAPNTRGTLCWGGPSRARRCPTTAPPPPANIVTQRGTTPVR